MGLLQYITLHYFSNRSQHLGLLRLADKILSNESIKDFSTEPYLFDKPFFKFHEFAEELGLFKTALFIPHKSMYKIIFSHGFDNVSIEKSESTMDFWDGTLEGNSWIAFKGNSINIFSQFFSSHDSEKIQDIFIKRVPIKSKNCIFLFCTQNKNYLPDYESLDEVISQLFLTITPIISQYMPSNSLQNDSYTSISSMIDIGLSEFKQANSFEISNSLFTESKVLNKNEIQYLLFLLFCRIKFATLKPNICFLSNSHSIKIILFSHENIDSDMYEMYLLQNLQEYYTPDTLSYFSVKDHGVSTSKSQLESFLFSGN